MTQRTINNLYQSLIYVLVMAEGAAFFGIFYGAYADDETCFAVGVLILLCLTPIALLLSLRDSARAKQRARIRFVSTTNVREIAKSLDKEP